MDNEKPLLSPRQKQIVEYLAAGYSAKGISASIGIKTNTVAKYIHRIKRRFGAKSAAHCVAIAIQRGYIDINLPLDTPVNQRPNGGEEILKND